jgi:hypothetical protein
MSNLHLSGVLVLTAITGACASPRNAQTTPLPETLLPPESLTQDPPRRTDDRTLRTTEPVRQDPPPRVEDRTVRTAQPVRQDPPPRRDDRSILEERQKTPWEVTLSGVGTNDEEFNVGNGQLAVSVGYYFTEVLELVVRQGVSYSDDEGSVGGGASDDDVWNFQSRVALDVHIPMGNFVPYVGGNVGYLYGDTDTLDDTFAIGPEAGVKIYLQKAAFLQLGAEWEFFTDRKSSIDDTFEDGQLFYFAGFGLRF